MVQEISRLAYESLALCPPKGCEATYLLNTIVHEWAVCSVFTFRILLGHIWTHFTKADALLQCKGTGGILVLLWHLWNCTTDA